MASRRSLSTKDRARLFALHGGICHLCNGKIDGTREKWEISHDIPLGLGGADDDANRMPAHYRCHRVHTATVDIPNIAKAKRRAAINTGAKIKGKSFPPPARRNGASAPLIKKLPPRRMI